MPDSLREPGRIPVPLRLCRGCRQFVRIDNDACDFCGTDLDAAEAEYDATMTQVREAAAALRAVLAAHRE